MSQNRYAFKKEYPTLLEMMDDFGYSFEEASNVPRVIEERGGEPYLNWMNLAKS